MTKGLTRLKIVAMATFGVFVTVLVNGTAINRVHALKVHSSWREIVDTCEIQLPMLAAKPDANTKVLKSLADRFKNGDRIEVSIAYEGIHNKTYEYVEFKGFVKKREMNIPLVIQCEDASYLFRKVSVYKEWKRADNPTIKKVVNYLIEEVNKTTAYKITLASDAIPDMNFDTFRIGTNEHKINALEALQFLKDEYGLAIYFDDLTLHVRLAYTDAASLGTQAINLQGNVVEHKLTVREKGEVQLYIEGKAILKNNTVIEAKYPPEGKGDARPYVTYDAKDEATLLQLMKSHYLKQGTNERVEGTVTTFLIPYVRHSMVVELKDPEFEIKKGNYLVDTTELSYEATAGVRRVITPGIKI